VELCKRVTVQRSTFILLVLRLHLEYVLRLFVKRRPSFPMDRFVIRYQRGQNPEKQTSGGPKKLKQSRIENLAVRKSSLITVHFDRTLGTLNVPEREGSVPFGFVNLYNFTC
jgi:hypothetical protein